MLQILTLGSKCYKYNFLGQISYSNTKFWEQMLQISTFWEQLLQILTFLEQMLQLLPFWSKCYKY